MGLLGCVRISESGWHIVANNRVVDTPITSIYILKLKKFASTPTIHSLPVNKTKLVLPKGLKVKDVVPASDNWGSFVVMEIISKKHIVAKFKGDKTLYDIKL